MPQHGLNFDWTVTFGTTLQILTMVLLAVAVFNALAARVTVFENTLKNHAESLKAHADRLDRHETRIIELIGSLQRIIGRSELHIHDRDRQ